MINGGAGNDIIGGGRGRYLFFNTALNAATNVDTIDDFSCLPTRSGGKRHIRGSRRDRNACRRRIPVGTAAADASDRIIYNSVTGDLTEQFERNRPGGSVQFATLGCGTGVNMIYGSVIQEATDIRCVGANDGGSE